MPVGGCDQVVQSSWQPSALPAATEGVGVAVGNPCALTFGESNVAVRAAAEEIVNLKIS